MSAIYLIAKYSPDLDRQEPRNFGVIVWTKGRIALKFLKDSQADFVEDQGNYSRWISYWQRLASDTRIQVFSERPATINSQRFLKQIQMTQKGNYRLHDGGEVPDATADNLEQVASFLFGRLVAKERDTGEANEPSLQQRCNEFLMEVGLMLRDGFRKRFPVKLLIDGLETEIHFDYGLGAGGNAQLLFNRVNLSQENNIVLAAGKCSTATKYGKCPREYCFSLFDSSLEAGDFDANVHFLNTFSIPVDIADRPTAAKLVQPAIAL